MAIVGKPCSKGGAIVKREALGPFAKLHRALEGVMFAPPSKDTFFSLGESFFGGFFKHSILEVGGESQPFYRRKRLCIKRGAKDCKLTNVKIIIEIPSQMMLYSVGYKNNLLNF